MASYTIGLWFVTDDLGFDFETKEGILETWSDKLNPILYSMWIVEYDKFFGVCKAWYWSHEWVINASKFAAGSMQSMVLVPQVSCQWYWSHSLCVYLSLSFSLTFSLLTCVSALKWNLESKEQVYTYPFRIIIWCSSFQFL